MLALQHYRDHLLCPCGCGWPKSVSQDPMTEWYVRVGEPTRCHVRTALIRAQQDAKGRKHPEALLWSAQLQMDSP